MFRAFRSSFLDLDVATTRNRLEVCDFHSAVAKPPRLDAIIKSGAKPRRKKLRLDNQRPWIGQDMASLPTASPPYTASSSPLLPPPLCTTQAGHPNRRGRLTQTGSLFPAKRRSHGRGKLTQLLLTTSKKNCTKMGRGEEVAVKIHSIRDRPTPHDSLSKRT